MTRFQSIPRPDWQERTSQQGLVFHTNADGSPYWDETGYYQFTAGEIEVLEAAGAELHQMFLTACDAVIQGRRFRELGIPESLHDLICRSWEADEWELYGRFDLALSGDTPKLIEYNADTPTGLLEASIIQWYWKQDLFPEADQFNSIHEALVNRWRDLAQHGELQHTLPLHVSCLDETAEDRMTVGYLGETAEQAGFSTEFVAINELGWNANTGEFVDEQDKAVRQLFKLYPWEWLGVEPFSQHLLRAKWRIIEPPWKAVLASKALLIVLQELYPNHPYLLPVAREPLLEKHVRKPIFGREGRAVTIHKDQPAPSSTDAGFIYQAFHPLHQCEPYHAQIGLWMIGPQACGIGIREDNHPILTNSSRFVPHIMEG